MEDFCPPEQVLPLERGLFVKFISSIHHMHKIDRDTGTEIKVETF